MDTALSLKNSMYEVKTDRKIAGSSCHAERNPPFVSMSCQLNSDKLLTSVVTEMCFEKG